MTFFNDIVVLINGTGVLANSAGISTNNSVQPIKLLGLNRPPCQIPQGPVVSKCSISYIPNLKNDKVFEYVRFARTGDYNQSPSFTLSMGGLSGSFYLDSVSFRLSENSIFQNSVSFSSYNQLSGSIRAQDYNETFDSNELGLSETTVFNQGIYGSPTNVLGFEYSFTISPQPLYRVGRSEPSQMLFDDLKETVVIDSEVYNHIQYSGQDIEDYTDVTKVTLNSASMLFNQTFGGYDVHSEVFSITGFQVTSNKVSYGLNDIARTSVEGVKYR